MNIVIDEKLEHGYYIIRKVDAYGHTPESTLAKIKLNKDSEVQDFSEIFSSKFRYKLLKYYEMVVMNDKRIVKNFTETLEGLTVQQLENMLPSYYQPEIMQKIKELNAVTKTKRTRKGTTKTGNRKRNIHKKSV